MDLTGTIRELKARRELIDTALAALTSIVEEAPLTLKPATRRGRPLKEVAAAGTGEAARSIPPESPGAVIKRAEFPASI